MSKSVWKGALLGGLVLFVWGNISWLVLPWHDMTMRTFADEAEVERVITANTDGRGIYLYPGEHHEPGMSAQEQAAAEEDVARKMEKGPFLFVALRDGGTTSMAGPLIVGLIVQILAALVLTLIVGRCAVAGFWDRVSVVVLVVVAAGILCYLPLWNWFGFATGFTVVMILDLVVGGLVAGLVIARVV